MVQTDLWIAYKKTDQTSIHFLEVDNKIIEKGIDNAVARNTYICKQQELTIVRQFYLTSCYLTMHF